MYYGNPPIITTGLVLNLDAGNNKSYPSLTTEWKDLSGNFNSASLVNGVGYTKERGGALIFDGSNDYADFYAPNLATTTTVEMWCKIKTNYNGKMFFGWNQYDVWCGSNHLGFNTAGSDSYGISSSRVSELELINNWKHYVFEMRSDVSYTNNKIYVNSENQTLSQQLTSEVPANRNFNNGLGRIAQWRASAGYEMPMDCSIFRVYNRALTEREITQNFNALKSRFGI